jgi:hypothetical protein
LNLIGAPVYLQDWLPKNFAIVTTHGFCLKNADDASRQWQKNGALKYSVLSGAADIQFDRR